MGTSKDLRDIAKRKRAVVVKELNDFIKMLSVMGLSSFGGILVGLFLTAFTDPFQCRRWTDGLLHCDRYHARYGRKRRCRGHLQLRQSLTVSSHQHGTDRGTAASLQST